MSEKINIWLMLENHFNEFPQDMGGPVNESEVTAAENDLKVTLSLQYRNFLLRFGAAGIGPYDVYGLRRLQLMKQKKWSFVDVTHFYRDTQKWPGIENWYVISDDGSGNPIGLDPEGTVWLSDHDSGFEKIKLADDFEEFLYRVYTETLYED